MIEVHESYPAHHQNDVKAVIESIAPNAEIYIEYIDSLVTYQLFPVIEKLLTDYYPKPDIINISLRTLINDQYAAEAALIVDYWSNASDCLFIVSAGNSTKTTDDIMTPGEAANVLTVGATNISKDLYYQSLYGTGFTYFTKPELVAPGENLIGLGDFPGTTESQNASSPFLGISGTSFSAPMITGVAALLMDEFDYLKGNPEALKAILMESCSPLENENIPHFDEQSGAGLINYRKARDIANNHQFATAFYTDEACSHPLIETTISIPKHTTAYFYFVQLVPGVALESASHFPTMDYAISSYTIEIIDVSASNSVSTAINTSTGFISYSNNTNAAKECKVKVFLSNDDFDTVYNGNELAEQYGGVVNENPTYKVAIAYNVPNHSNHIYPTVWSQNALTHYKNCTVCGYVQSASHTISLGKCIVCGFRSSTVIEPWNKPDQPELN